MSRQYLLYVLLNESKEYYWGKYATEESVLQAWKDAKIKNPKFKKCKIFNREGGISYFD